MQLAVWTAVNGKVNSFISESSVSNRGVHWSRVHYSWRNQQKWLKRLLTLPSHTNEMQPYANDAVQLISLGVPSFVPRWFEIILYILPGI